MERTIVIYETTDGKCPFLDWLNGLKDIKARATIRARLDRVRLKNLGDSKTVGEGVFELRINFGPGYRLYFGQEKSVLVVLLCGGDKSSQARDIARANIFGGNIMPIRSYQNELIKQLRNTKEAAEYLNACYQESEEVFFVGLRNVVEAHGGVGAVARLTDLNRENLYRLLSEKGNPKFSSLAAILEAVGIDIKFTPVSKRKNAA